MLTLPDATRLTAECRNAFFPTLLLLLSFGTANAQHEPGCAVTNVRFTKGSSGTVISGMALWDDILCFDLDVREGQQVTMRVIEGDNTIFSIYGVQDAQNDFSFTAPTNKVQFLVSQLIRAPRPQPFRIKIDVR